MNKYIKGSVVQIFTQVPFTDLAGAPVNPDKVIIAFSIDGVLQAEYTWINGTGDLTGIIQNPSLGNFSANIDSTLYPSGLWDYTIFGLATSLDADTSRTQIRQEGQLIIDDPQVPITI